ncbi:galectin-1 [Monodelphis domestica]|uniref:Galectin n=1 Tax=Monodelphis domestica TaxID=13616 RepID=F6US49_MONDO|nr:galectin-1 [Monodelphis domestica]XP_044533761.1 galectin-1 [Gracilinanus agilis]
MASEILASNLNLKPGVCVRIVGDVLPDAKSFRLNLGKDHENLALHFNPRFDCFDDTNVIVCNSRQEGSWGAEQRETSFPFLPGSQVEVCFAFEGSHFTVRLPDGSEFKFPNRLNLDTINFLEANGDFKLRSVNFD